MGIPRDMLDHLGHLLRPLRTRIANSIGRGTVQLADDTKKLQLLQVGVLAGETVDSAQHHQTYGFSSVPQVGAEVVVVFPNGDRSHPLVIAASDRRYRPVGGEAGQVTVYHYNGAQITMLADGNIRLTPKAGCDIIMAGASTGPTGEGVVVGTGIDPFTGQTYNALQNASSKVFAKK